MCRHRRGVGDRTGDGAVRLRFANLQASSGSQANQSALLGLAKAGDTILRMNLDAGGHLTDGARPNLSGKWFNAIQYGVTADTHLVDFDQAEALGEMLKVSGLDLVPGGTDTHVLLVGLRSKGVTDKNVYGISASESPAAEPAPLVDDDDVTAVTHDDSKNYQSIGTQCTDDSFSACISRGSVLCCFNSPLARFTQESASPQFGHDFGSAEIPNCCELTSVEIQDFDWAVLDLDQWIAILGTTSSGAVVKPAGGKIYSCRLCRRRGVWPKKR